MNYWNILHEYLLANWVLFHFDASIVMRHDIISPDNQDRWISILKVQSSEHRFFCWKGCLKIIGWFHNQGSDVKSMLVHTELIRSGGLNLDNEKISPNIVF